MNIKIYDYDTYIEDGYIIFDEKIIEVGEMKNFPGFGGFVIDGKNKILLPGLINFHTHIYSTLIRGSSQLFAPKNYHDTIEQLWWKFDSHIDNDISYHSALVYGLESMKNGVTSIVDHHASGNEITGSLGKIKKALVDELGMRGVFCFETSDRFNVESCIKENMATIDFNCPQAQGMFGLHASLSLSETTLEKVEKEISETTIPIHAQVAESEIDEEKCIQKYNMRIVERFQKHNLLHKNSILAHCVHISEREAEIIKEEGALVVINPTSNMNNAVGIFNIDLFRKYEIPLLIGTDGLGTNIAKEWTYLLYLGKLGIKDANGIELEEIKEYIAHSYEYFSNIMGTKIGKIQKGHVADFLLIEYHNPTEMTAENVFGHLFFGPFESFQPSFVFINGRMRIANYNSIFDDEKIYLNAQKAAKRLWERANPT